MTQPEPSMLTEHGVLPIALGDNWTYALPTDDGIILVDAGPDYDGAWDALSAQLDAAGLDIRDVRTVVVTHAHIDHCGLAYRWQDQGVPVAAWESESPQFLHGRNIIGYQTQYVFQTWRDVGVPEERITGFIEDRERMRQAFRAGDFTGGGRRRERWPGLIRGTPFRPDDPLPDGAEITVGGRTLVLIAAPGHTPGNAICFEPATGALFSGDQIIPGVNSNPGWHWNLSTDPPSRFRSLPAFAASLEKVDALDAAYLYPGHGEHTESVQPEIERTRRHHQRRQAQLREILAEGPATPYTLLMTLFKRLPDRRLWQALAEVIGHTDALVARGEAVEFDAEGLVTIRLA